MIRMSGEGRGLASPVFWELGGHVRDASPQNAVTSVKYDTCHGSDQTEGKGHAQRAESMKPPLTVGDSISGITVVIPTYNRCSILSKALKGLCNQTKPEYIREVIIINDGSTDSTQEVVEQFSSLLPIRYYELTHGSLSAARNSGLREAGVTNSVRAGNGSVSVARNLGLREAGSSIVLFLDRSEERRVGKAWRPRWSPE